MEVRRSTSQIVLARGLAALLATSLVFHLGQVRAAPGDIFTQAAPVIGADPPKAAELRSGDASVSTQTGALQYVLPDCSAAGPEWDGSVARVELLVAGTDLRRDCCRLVVAARPDPSGYVARSDGGWHCKSLLDQRVATRGSDRAARLGCIEHLPDRER